MKEILWIIKFKGLESLEEEMVLFIEESGLIICKMEEDMSNGLKGILMKGNIRMV